MVFFFFLLELGREVILDFAVLWGAGLRGAGVILIIGFSFFVAGTVLG